ncbi:hypothetical protein [Metallosphaera sp.]|uniref:hypothetical protein n=1 Tax=Metallosphaera sp. TaxID=2020860 RepID=UPI00315ECF8F
MSQEVEKTQSKIDFLISNDGTKVPAVATLKFGQYISKGYIKLQFLYDIKRNDFINGIIRNNKNTNDIEKIPNYDILYRVSLGEYLLFTLETNGNSHYIVFGICKVKITAKNVNDLIFSEWYADIENEECVNSNVYLNQLGTVNSENKLINKMLYIAKFYLNISDSNNIDYFEIPKNDSGEHYEWNDLKQSILYLRQPF